MTANTQVLNQVKAPTFLNTLFQILGGSLFLALCAQVEIPLPFSPVPISMQTLAVALVGAFLGKKKGALCVMTYLAESMMGLPVLAGGAIKPLALLGPTGGYLVGMIIQAYIVGWYYERRMGRHFTRDFLFNSVSGAVTLLVGCLWLAHFVGWENVLMMGCYPFLIGDALKSVVVTRIMMCQQRIKL